MIAKTVEGSGFKGALNYNSKGLLLSTNFASQDTNSMSRETKFTRELRPNFQNAVWHTSLSLPPSEKLTQKQWVEIAEKYLKAMGFNLLLNQYAVFLHNDTDNNHIHIVANKIGSDGNVVSNFNNYKKQDVFCRKIEQEYGLIAVPVPKPKDRKIAISKNEIALNERTGELTPRLFIAQTIEQLLENKPSLEQFITDLAFQNINVALKKNDATGEVKGISFAFDGQSYTGSGIGRQFSFSNLVKKGLNYEQSSTNKNTDATSNNVTINTTKPDAATIEKSRTSTTTANTSSKSDTTNTNRTAQASFKSFNSYVSSVSTDNSSSTVQNALNTAQQQHSSKQRQKKSDPETEHAVHAVLQVTPAQLKQKLSTSIKMLKEIQKVLVVAQNLADTIIKIMIQKTSFTIKN